MPRKVLLFGLLLFVSQAVHCKNLPLVINTWGFSNATAKAWSVLTRLRGSALDALVEGCTECEREQCDGTVGYGGSPDENGETTLDAMVMDGSNMNIGAVAALRNVKDAIKVARNVLLNTRHTLLVGDQASSFAESMGHKLESLITPKSKSMWKNWRDNKCQPNFRTNVDPDPSQHCGPYTPKSLYHNLHPNDVGKFHFGAGNHDTIGMIVIDSQGNIFAGTSTNGAKHKIPGRVGDSPIPGAGAYADNEVGAAAATGDGDVMMRFLPSFLAVEYLRAGSSPEQAAQRAIGRILRHYHDFVGGIIVTDKYGNYSAACAGMDEFPFSVASKGDNVRIEFVKC